MEWLGTLMQNNLVVGIVLLLGYLLSRAIERRQDAKSNGHFTARDREVQQGMADSIKMLVEANIRYQERGYGAMNEIDVVKRDVDTLGDKLGNLISQMLVTNTQLNTAVTSLLSNDKDKFALLREIRDRQKEK